MIFVHYTASDGPLHTHFTIGWRRLCDAARMARQVASLPGISGVILRAEKWDNLPVSH